MQGSPGGGWGGTRQRQAWPGLQGHLGAVVQVRAAEVKVHPCCFACHVPSWLSAKACHPPVSFLGRQWKRHPERDRPPCSYWPARAMLSGSGAESGWKAIRPLEAFTWIETCVVFPQLQDVRRGQRRRLRPREAFAGVQILHQTRTGGFVAGALGKYLNKGLLSPGRFPGQRGGWGGVAWGGVLASTEVGSLRVSLSPPQTCLRLWHRAGQQRVRPGPRGLCHVLVFHVVFHPLKPWSHLNPQDHLNPRAA